SRPVADSVVPLGGRTVVTVPESAGGRTSSPHCASSLTVSTSRRRASYRKAGRVVSGKRVSMDDPRDLVEGLTLLGDALDDPFVDLHAVLEALGDDLVAAIPGYLGLTVAVQFGEHPVVINTLDLDDAHEAAATLMLPLAPVKHAGATGTVVFYSRTAGAFGPMAG